MFNLHCRYKISVIANRIKGSNLIPLWLAYAVWFVETAIFYDWRWARNRMVQLIER